MLYKFQCKKSADVLMLEDLTSRIFEVIDRPLEAKGVFLVEQLPVAIQRLEAAIAEDEKLRKEMLEEKSDNKEGSPPKVKHDRLGQRAFPFIQLLKAGLANQEMVIWGV
mgnify:CR=1 FL=1|jgi:hypothetical protein